MYEKGRYRFLEICSYSWETVCSNSLEKLSLQWIQQGSPSEVSLWVLQENSISVFKDEVLYIKEERVVKVPVDNVAVVGELKPNHGEADTRMLVHTSYALENGATSVFVCSLENDVLFLLLHHQSNLHCIRLYMFTGLI